MRCLRNSTARREIGQWTICIQLLVKTCDILCTNITLAPMIGIDQFHVLRYCFLNNVICNADLMIAHKHVFVFNNYDRS